MQQYIPTQKNDRLRISAWSSVASISLFFIVTQRDASGKRVITTGLLTPLGTIAEATADVHLTAGELLSVVVYTDSTTLVRGQCYVRALVFEGAVFQKQPHVILCADYLTLGQPLAFPGGPIRSSVTGPGVLKIIEPANPAAGADLSYTIPASTRFKPSSVRITLTTAVAAATRRAILYLLNAAAGSGVQVHSAPFTQLASTTVAYFWHNFATDGLSLSSGSAVYADLPVLPAARAILVSIDAIQAADQISGAFIVGEEWLVV